jgi:hypothetical protein
MTDHNRRGSRLRHDNKPATIKLGLFKKLQCEVRDVSPGGARLVMPEGFDVPDQFELRLPQFKRPRTCLRRWESGREVGVEFILE